MLVIKSPGLYQNITSYPVYMVSFTIIFVDQNNLYDILQFCFSVYENASLPTQSWMIVFMKIMISFLNQF
jgi:hypothetical protein